LDDRGKKIISLPRDGIEENKPKSILNPIKSNKIVTFSGDKNLT
jgi:hypothetical protein